MAKSTVYTYTLQPKTTIEMWIIRSIQDKSLGDGVPNEDLRELSQVLEISSCKEKKDDRIDLNRLRKIVRDTRLGSTDNRENLKKMAP